MTFAWEKPVIVFYKERRDKPERNAFLVVKARTLVVSRSKGGAPLVGNIREFFPLMGDIDYISSEKGISGRYVLCWFDDEEDDFSNAWRKLTSVAFPNGIAVIISKDKKRTYNAAFEAAQGKLE